MVLNQINFHFQQEIMMPGFKEVDIDQDQVFGETASHSGNNGDKKKALQPAEPF